MLIILNFWKEGQVKDVTPIILNIKYVYVRGNNNH